VRVILVLGVVAVVAALVVSACSREQADLVGNALSKDIKSASGSAKSGLPS
jgi:mevalonate pyrophosphate decarboxylase